MRSGLQPDRYPNRLIQAIFKVNLRPGFLILWSCFFTLEGRKKLMRMKEDYRILLVDDEPDLLDLIADILIQEGFCSIEKAASAKEAIRICQTRKISLVILDIMLPDQNGFEVCREIRKFSTVPILFLSAKSEESDKVLGLAIGADDYICKPFSQKELAYRVHARYRREAQFEKNSPEHFIHAGDLCIDPLAQTVSRNGQEIPLTATEYRILLYLAENKNRIISKERLYEAIWKEICLDGGNAVMVHMRHLRQKIEPDPSHPAIIQTVTGLGYRLMETADHAVRPL